MLFLTADREDSERMGLHRSNFPSTPEKMRLSKTNWPTYASELKELCESRGGRIGLPVEVAVVSSPSLIVIMVSVDVKQHLKES